MTVMPGIAFAQIEPVGQCNLRCRMCPIQFRKDGPPHGPPAFMPYARFCRLLEQMDDLRELHLQGLGEPLMHPRFFDMVRFAAQRGVRVSTNTNLTLLTPHRALECVRSGLHEIHVSIDGATADTFEHIRVKARFSRVLRNLDRLMQACTRSNSSRPSVRMVVVAMRRNLHELAEIVALAAAHGVGSVFVQHLCHDFGEETLPEDYRPMRDFVSAQSLLGERPSAVDFHFTKARDAAKRLGIELRLPRLHPLSHTPSTPGRERCDWPWRGPYISYQGLAMPCCMVATPDRIHFGDAVEELNGVWNGPAYERFREALSSSRPPEVCQSCSIYHRVF